MKYKFLRLSLLGMLVMFFGGLAYAQDETIDFSALGYDNAAEVTTVKGTDVTLTFDKGTNSNTPKYYTTGTAVRLYGGNTLKVSSSTKTIEKVVFTFDGSNNLNDPTVDEGSYDSETSTWTGSASEFTITRGGTSGHARIQKMEFYYAAGGEADTRTATTLTLGEHQTTGVVGESMNLPTVTVATADGAPVENAEIEWTSSNTDVATIADGIISFNATGTTTVKASFAGDDNYKASSASFTLTVTAAPYTSIAAMLADITSTRTTVIYQFENLLVTYVNGPNTFVSDGRNGFLFYGSNLGLNAGEQITGTATGQLYTYYGLPEMSLSADGISAEVVSESNLVAWTTITAADLQSYINIPVTIEDAVYVEASGKNLTFKVGEETLSVYNNWSINVTALEADKAYTLTGIGSVYSRNETTTYQLYLVSFEEKAEEEGYVYRDFAVQLTNADIFDTSVMNFGVKVAEDGTYTATAADDETANFTVSAARFNDAQHGWANCTFTVPVQGAVKIELGDCQYGGQNGTINDAAGNVTDIKANATKKCWSANAPHENVVVAYYAGTEPTTLTIKYTGYCPFIAVTAIDPSEIPSEATVTFSIDGVACEGVAPTAQKVEIGATVTIPVNTTLYKEGFTLTAWTDGTAEYAAGQQVTVSEDITLTPVFTENAAAFADRTAETTITWQFGEGNGAGTLNAQGKSTILVAQATIGESVIDVKMDIDATNGKINNVGRGDKWAQCNDGTVLTIPAYKGTAVSFDSYSDGTGTTIGGVEATDKAATYEGTAETLDIVAKGIGYIASVTAVYPVPSQDEPGDEPAVEYPILYTWDFTDANSACTLVGGGQGTTFSYPSDKDADVTLEVDATNGKFNPRGTDVQVNATTTIAVPVKSAGDVITIYNYRNGSNGVEYTIGAETKTAADVKYEYTVSKIEAETGFVTITVTGSGYMDKFTVLQNEPQSEEGETFDNEVATVVWPFNTPSDIAAYTATPADAFVTVAANTGDIELTGTGTGQAKYPDGSTVTFAKLKPSGSTQAVEWAVKPAAGLTFTPTKVSAYIARFGTDVENGITITAKAGDGETITLGNFTAPRNNKSQADDKYGKNSNYTNQFVIELTEAQQATLTSADGLSVFGTVGVGSAKEGGYAEMTIEGLINGTKADVALYTLAVAASPEEAGSISVYPAANQYEAGSEVTLTATENFGYDFVNWTNAEGEEVSTEAKFKYTVNSDAVLTANFVKVDTYELALTVDGTNDYMVKVNPAPTMVDGKMMYEDGTAVQLQADQYEGLVTFTNWSDGETNSSKLVSMSEDIQLTAYYAQADIIAGWDFYKSGGSGRKADFAAQDNDTDALNLVNTETGETSGWLDKSTEAAGGYESFKGAAVNWRTGASNGDVGNWHWQTKVNAEAFTDINVQFQMLYNYNAYQRYDAEYSLDGTEWTKFGSITMTGAKTAASFNEQMPAKANNQANLYIRMIADKTSDIDGTASANDGNSLAMFFITGTPKLVDDGTAPVLVSSVPADGATGASATGKIVLTFDERVKVADDATATLADQILTPAVSGKTVTFEYKGLEYGIEYTFELPGNSVADLTDNYIAEPITLTFTTMERPTVTKKLYDFIVPDDGTFAEALKAAAARSDQNVRYRIFVKQGEYMIPAGQKGYTDNNGNFFDYPDPRTYFNSPNVSIIGEDPALTSITNEMPNSLVANSDAGGTSGANPVEGIRSSGVLYLQSGATDTYFQDIKLWSATADNTGRNVVLVDGGNRTVCKNVTLWAYQDTYVSDNTRSTYYFEGGLLRGRTDFLCGSGDVFYNNVTLQMCEAGGYIAVPRDNVKYGYVFKDCTIKGEGSGIDGRYYLGRPWTKGAEVYYIDTKMEVIPYAAGWHDMSADGCTRMAEWNSMTASGSTVDLSGRTKVLGGNPNDPILTAEEALEIGNLHNMFGDWDPTLLTEQAPIPQNVELAGNELTWTGSNYALLYAIVKDGAVVDFTTGNAYTVDDTQARWAVRAANEMGGLGETAIADVTTGIKSMNNDQRTMNKMVYDLQGRRVDQPRKGLYIVNGRKVVK